MNNLTIFIVTSLFFLGQSFPGDPLDGIEATPSSDGFDLGGKKGYETLTKKEPANVKNHNKEPSKKSGKQQDKIPPGAVQGRCPEGSEGQDALVWVDHAAEQGGNNIAGASEGIGGYVLYCFPDAEDISGEPIVISVSVEEFRRLPLAGSGIVIEPDRDDYVIHLPVIGLTDPSAQVLTTTILGINVAVRATPVEYAWDFGDGSQPLVTTDPGRSYPEQTVEHLYTELGDFTISLTTTWEGEFSIDGGATWLPINGTTTTTDTAAPIRVEERVPLLVNGDNT